MDSELKACCFTGHRLIMDITAQKLRKELEAVILELYEKGYRKFYSGGAIGFDMLAAETVIEIRKKYSDIKLCMALPCRNHYKNWNKTEKKKFERVLTDSDECVYLCESYCTGCMHLRNKYMVNNSQICVAYYNRGRGGTESTMNYAREKECEIINLAYRA